MVGAARLRAGSSNEASAYEYIFVTGRRTYEA